MKLTFPNPILALLLAPAAYSQGSTLYSNDFTTLDGWTVVNNCGSIAEDYGWSADATPANHPAGPYVSPPASLNFNNGVDIGATGGGHGGLRTCGWVTSDPIDLSLASGQPRLQFMASWDTETDCGWDMLDLKVLSEDLTTVLLDVPCINSFPTSTWQALDYPLDSSWGAVRIRFEFDTIDGVMNWGTGPFIDDLAIVDVGVLHCFGDGSAGACACSNESETADRAGCKHSGGAGGKLRTSGLASLANDTLVLLGSSMPDQPVLYFQADASQPPTPFGGGLLCTGGVMVRLGAKLNTAGSSAYPSGSDPPVSIRGMVQGPGLYHYSAWFRDTGSFCSPAEPFNLTNAVSILWEP